MERVETFFAAVPAKVEFRPYAPEAARFLAQKLAKEAGIQLGLAELALLLEATGGDASRISMEIEKLRLFAGTARKITAADIAELVPDAQSTTIFALVAALGRGDRVRALEILDTLSRAGEYMPLLALTFLATQFRTALAAREAGVRGAGQIQAHFNKLGGRMWPERARQIEQTMEAFSKERLALAVEKVFETDRGLRDARPDDRIVMEEMIPRANRSLASNEPGTCRLRRGDLANPDGQTALVNESSRVLLDDAPLGGAIDHGESLRDEFGRTLGVFRFQEPAHRPDLVPQTSLAGPVDARPAFGHSDALQRGYCVCHWNP